jgi:hypothetical protein
MSPLQRRLEERIHTFSAPLDTGRAMSERLAELSALDPQANPAPVAYNAPNRGAAVFAAYCAWEQTQNERSRVTRELDALGREFNSYVTDLHAIIPFGRQQHRGQPYGLHGDLEVRRLDSSGEPEYFVCTGEHTIQDDKKRSIIDIHRAVRLGVQPSYHGSLQSLLHVFAGKEVPMYATSAKLWALHPHQGTSDGNWLFSIDRDKIEINPAGVPAGAEDVVVNGWYNMLKRTGYDKVFSIEPKLSRKSQEISVPVYEPAAAVANS